MTPSLTAFTVEARSSAKARGIVLPEANTGNPLKGDFERMARRRFQDPTPPPQQWSQASLWVRGVLRVLRRRALLG